MLSLRVLVVQQKPKFLGWLLNWTMAFNASIREHTVNKSLMVFYKAAGEGRKVKQMLLETRGRVIPVRKGKFSK